MIEKPTVWGHIWQAEVFDISNFEIWRFWKNDIYLEYSYRVLNLGRGEAMSYRIEIELPRSGAWFKYFPRIDSLEEAEDIKKIAEGKINARIRKNA